MVPRNDAESPMLPWHMLQFTLPDAGHPGIGVQGLGIRSSSSLQTIRQALETRFHAWRPGLMPKSHALTCPCNKIIFRYDLKPAAWRLPGLLKLLETLGSPANVKPRKRQASYTNKPDQS